MQQKYDPDKSHLSAEAKTEFLQSAKPNSNVMIVPGIGKVTASRLHHKGVATVQDLVEKTDNSYALLKELVGPVNSHKIFDALTSYNELTRAPLKSIQNLENAMADITLVDKKTDKQIAKEIEKNQTCAIQ
tara:strand:+ start:2352 stop:2744 length:393 start_codon:yes stop_codon:yes gene_type:complete